MKKERKATNAVSVFVNKLNKEQIEQIIHDYDVLSVDGSIGGCELRRQAEALMNELHATNMVVMWMESVYREALAYMYYNSED